MKQTVSTTIARMPRLIVLLSLVALLAVGCGSVQEVGGEIRTKAARTAVSLSPSTSELIMLSTPNVTLLGRTQACNFPKEVEDIPIVGSVKPDYEKILKLQPEFVIYDETVYGEADIAKLKSLNLELISMNVHNLDEYYTFLQKLGSLTGNETGMNDYIEKCYEKQKNNEATAPEPRPKTVILLGDPGSEYMAAGLKSFQADLAKWSGAEVVGPDSNKFERVSVEVLMQWNPDIIVTTADPLKVIADPRLAAITAIKQKHVAGVKNPDVLLRAGNRVDQVLVQLGNAIRAIAKDSVHK